MSRPAPPALTVRYEGSTRTFAAGSDVVIGRDLRADLRIAHPLISRAHVVLRFDQGRWMAIDNGSLNGVYVNGRRVPAVDIQDGQQINIGNPDGPALTFEVGRHQGAVGMTPKTTSVPMASRPSASWPTAPPQARPPVHHPPAGYPSAPSPTGYPSGPPSGIPQGPSRQGAPILRAQHSRCVRARCPSRLSSPSRRWVRRPRPARARGTSRRAC